MTITNSTIMVVLESCPKHNMVTYLEKTDGNVEFHESIGFLARSSIHNALTVSPVVSTTFVKQFWMSAKSKIINNVRYIIAKVAGKPMSISEASIRSDLLFYDADGIDSLPNQAIFDAIQLMGHLDAKKKFVMYPRFILVFLDKQLKNVPVPLDHFLVNALTKDEGEESKRPSEPQPTPSPPHPSEVHVETQSDPSPRPSPTTHIPDFILEDSGGNHGDQAKQIKHLKAQIKKLKKKPTKAEPSVHKDLAFDELADDTMDYIENEDAQDVGRTRDVLNEEKETADDEEEVSTDRPHEGTDDQTEGRNDSQIPPTTSTPFGDDETIAQVFIIMSQTKEKLKEKEKGVELKDVEETKRPRPTSTISLLTLKPLPKIDPKDKGKKKIEEEDKSDTKSDAEEEVKKQAEEEAIKAELSNEYDFIQARIISYRLLALRLQEEEIEQFTMEEKAKFLHDTIAAQRRNQMVTYLKHVGNKKHSDLKNKTFEEIQVLYEKVKRFDESFTVVGSTEDERQIKEMNEGASDPDKKKKIVKEDVSVKLDVDSDDEHRKCLKIFTFEGTLDIEVMKIKSIIARMDKVSSPDGDYLVIYRANGNFRAFNCLLEVLHIFDRQDLFHLYDLVMEQYLEITLEGIELILWGDLKIIMESSQEENDQSDF
ncbi:hypothetical protein Tco_1173236 [Tanacetum coccineum]